MWPSPLLAIRAKPSHTFASLPRNKAPLPAAVSSAQAWITGSTQSQHRATARAICGLEASQMYAQIQTHTHTLHLRSHRQDLPGLLMKSQWPRQATSILLRNRTVGTMLDCSSWGALTAGSLVSSGYRQKHFPAVTIIQLITDHHGNICLAMEINQTYMPFNKKLFSLPKWILYPVV